MDLACFRFYVVTALLAWCINCKLVLSKVEITCFCNTPACQEEGRTYCTSHLGKCYNKNWYHPDQAAAYGCVDELGPKERSSCIKNGDVVNKAPGQDYFLTCCEGREGDICNEPREPPIDVSIIADTPENHSSVLGGHIPKDSSRNQQDEVYYSSRELWFKAAVIAVPIAGGFILILLVLLAVRMLRQDSRHHRQMKHNQSLAKAQLYVADHFYNPNNKLLYNYCEEEKLAQQDCVYNEPCVHSSNCSSGNLKSIQKGINTQSNIPQSKDSHMNSNNTQKYSYEKLRDPNVVTSPHDSVMVWTEKETKTTDDVVHL